MIDEERSLVELEIIAGTFTEALIRNGYGELAEDFIEWWNENKPEDDGA